MSPNRVVSMETNATESAINGTRSFRPRPPRYASKEVAPPRITGIAHARGKCSANWRGARKGPTANKMDTKNKYNKPRLLIGVATWLALVHDTSEGSTRRNGRVTTAALRSLQEIIVLDAIFC